MATYSSEEEGQIIEDDEEKEQPVHSTENK